MITVTPQITRKARSTKTKRGFSCIALDSPKDAKNVGSVLRAAGCYGVSMVVVSNARYKHSGTDTQKAWRHLPLIQTNKLDIAIPRGCVCVAVELVEGARPLPSYVHPERAFYIFGGEDRTLSPEVLAMCRDVVSIPTQFCMNLAATVNVVLYDRMAKEAPKAPSVGRGNAANSLTGASFPTIFLETYGEHHL
jgi:tRNA(Leu) C34 or U34 (ribose-2'-O)-methylase TrmL